jgi:hypothetical protein
MREYRRFGGRVQRRAHRAPAAGCELRQVDEAIHDLIERIEEWQRSAPNVVEQHITAGGCYRLELVKCGKPTCHCATGASCTDPTGICIPTGRAAASARPTSVRSG